MGPFYLGKECVWIHGIYILCSGDLKCVEVIAHDISHTYISYVYVYMFGQKPLKININFCLLLKLKQKEL